MTRYKIRAAISVIITLTLAYSSAAQDKNASAKTAPRVALATATKPSGPQESMGIHGHWTVTVRNANGTIASRHEFENSITNQGKGFVLGLIIGDIFPLRGLPLSWQLKISGNLCKNAGVNALGDCFIPAKGNILVGGKLEFAGTIKMDGAGQITSVATQVKGSETPGAITFSLRDLTQPDSSTGQTPAPINVQAGQNVDFTVDLSIS